MYNAMKILIKRRHYATLDEVTTRLNVFLYNGQITLEQHEELSSLSSYIYQM